MHGFKTLRLRGAGAPDRDKQIDPKVDIVKSQENKVCIIITARIWSL